MNGGHAAAAALEAAGIRVATAVPGESFLGLLDALNDSPALRLITARHESGAGFMAEGYGFLTGTPAALFVTRMVGAGNASIALHSASQARTPLVAIIGQVASDVRHRRSFQEGELADIFSRIGKAAIEVPSADRIADLVYDAASIATTPPTGPVILSVREDDFVAEAGSVSFPERRRVSGTITPSTAAWILAELRSARQPAVLIGMGVRHADARDLAAEFASREQYPVFTAWRQTDAFDHGSPVYLGQVGLGAAPSVWDYLSGVDTLLVIGTRLDENSTKGFTIPGSDCHIISVDQENVWSSHRGRFTAIESSCDGLLRALIDESVARPDGVDQVEQRARLIRQRRETLAAELGASAASDSGPLEIGQVVRAISSELREDSIVTTDSGSFSGFLTRYLALPSGARFVGPIGGAMGYGIPSAIGARLGAPDARAIAIVGDGGFGMTGMELETAVREHLPIAVIVFDNQSYAAIARQQREQFPGRVIGTELGAIDVVRVAEALGARGIRAQSVADVADALGTWHETVDGPLVIHVPVDPMQSLSRR